MDDNYNPLLPTGATAVSSAVEI